MASRSRRDVEKQQVRTKGSKLYNEGVHRPPPAITTRELWSVRDAYMLYTRPWEHASAEQKCEIAPQFEPVGCVASFFRHFLIIFGLALG